MRCRIVVGPIPLAITARFAVRQKCLVRRNVNANPDFAHHRMDALDMAAQLMLPVETFGLVSAEVAIGLGSRRPLKGSFRDGRHLFRGSIFR